jgi:hypothetical protein
MHALRRAFASAAGKDLWSGGRLVLICMTMKRINCAVLSAELLLLALFTTGCRESRGQRLEEQASALAREGKYAEAIVKLEEAVSIYKDAPEARGASKQMVVYRGLLEAAQKETRRRANDDLLLLARKVLEYQLANGRYPSSLTLLPSHDTIPRTDPWGRPYMYETTDREGRGYRLGALGADGKPGGSGDDQDVLIVNGEFAKGLSWEDR